MEKLQAALEKARSRRTEAAAPPPRSAANAKPAASRTDQLWSDLPKITPVVSNMHTHHVVTQEASQKATPFDILRTKVLLQMRQNGWKSLAITSPMPKSGKTTMSCNLALGLGRQDELRTMLFDMDLQDPSVQKFLGHTPKYHMGQCREGQVDVLLFFYDAALPSRVVKEPPQLCENWQNGFGYLVALRASISCDLCGDIGSS